MRSGRRPLPGRLGEVDLDGELPAPRAEFIANADGSVDLAFGPRPPAAGESNWVQTIPGRHWFSYSRFYGPLEPYFDRSWKLGDITPS
jgi:hypothetical protein